MGFRDVRSSEWLSFVYFAVLTVVAWLRPLPAARRAQITAVGVVLCAATLWIARATNTAIRDWAAPAAIILVGYYLSGRFFVRPSRSFEEWLLAWDRRLLGDPAARFARWPRALLAYLDIVYMGCFLLPPAGFAVLAAAGRASLADRYWTMVIGAELGSFAPLALIQSRPPWAIEAARPSSNQTVHHVASRMVEQFTIRANTFPSGHVAGSLAVALALLGPTPVAGVIFLMLALSISVACVAGRYHYVVDGVAGGALAIAIWIIVIVMRV